MFGGRVGVLRVCRLGGRGGLYGFEVGDLVIL
jgi:uridine phosphorylase